jgi:hypothetical protein
MSSPLVFSGVRVTRSLVLCVMSCRSLFVLFLLAIVLSVLLRFTDSDYLFGIFKLVFFENMLLYGIIYTIHVIVWHYIYNTCALLKHIGNMCTRLRNGEKGEASPSLFPRFAQNTHIYLYASTVHM